MSTEVDFGYPLQRHCALTVAPSTVPFIFIFIVFKDSGLVETASERTPERLKGPASPVGPRAPLRDGECCI